MRIFKVILIKKKSVFKYYMLYLLENKIIFIIKFEDNMKAL